MALYQSRRRILAAVLAGLLAVSLAACGRESKTDPGENPAGEEPVGVAVQASVVTAQSIATDNKVSGQVVPEEKATIMVGVAAKCIATYVEAGDTVRRGEVLCRLDLDSTLSSYNAAKIGYDSAVQSFNDQRELFDKQIAVARENVAVAEGQIASVQEQIDLAERQIPVTEQQIAVSEGNLPLIENQISMTQTQLDQLDPQVELTERQVALAQKNVTDTQALFAAGAASQKELDQARIAADQAKIQLDQLKSSRDQLEYTISQLKQSLESTQAQLDQSRFSVEQMRVQINQSRFQLTQLVLNRDNAELQVRQLESTRNSTLAQLEAGIENAKSGVQQLDGVLSDVDDQGNVIAPIGGLLASFNAIENSYISNAAPLAVINGMDRMKLTTSVSEALVPKLSAGDRADVYIASVDRSLTAEIRSIEKSANVQTRLYTVTLSLPEGMEDLMAGMFADVTFHTDRVDSAIVVPSEAVLTSGTAQYVYTVENGTAKYVPVTTGLTGSGVTEILSGLTGGELLITVGQSYVTDGAPVRLVGGTA